MISLLTFFSALIVSVSLIPLMIRLAPRLGLLDYPNQRKVHTAPVPRAGGIGIVIGAIIPVLIWVPLDPPIVAYVFGSIILLLFGIWDDRRTLGASAKFIGQIIAAAVVVYYGNIYVPSLPFMNLHALPADLARPFTVFAIVGMINALNVSDGLDGLAGGLSILTLSGIIYLAMKANGTPVITIAIATVGGLLGFLRYNTLPARVFMGDGGSQFLGFTLGFLVIYLLQKIDLALSPALPVLLLGLPVADLLAVMVQRLRLGMSPFVATKHHVHHRFLEIGLDHYEAVIIIYLIQTGLVLSALPLCYESDGLILTVYVSVCALLFLFLFVSIRMGWQAHKSRSKSRLTTIITSIRRHPSFTSIPLRIVIVAIPLLFVTVSLLSSKVPRDFGGASIILAALLLAQLIFSSRQESLVTRTISYVTAAFVIYLEGNYVSLPAQMFSIAEIGFFVALAVAIGFAVRYSDGEFKTTPMDFLVILIVLSVGLLSRGSPHQAEIGAMAVKLVIVFYGCEFIIARSRNRWSVLNLSSLATLAIIGARGFGLV